MERTPGWSQHQRRECLTKAQGQSSEGPIPKPRAGRGVGDSQEAALTTRLLWASVEEAFPTALSSVDLCLEAISKNELIVGKAGVPGRMGEGWRQIRARKSCREGASRHHLGFKVSLWGHMGKVGEWSLASGLLSICPLGSGYQ